VTPGDRAYELVNGFRTSQIVHAAVELGIPDLLTDGSKSAADLARATGIETSRLRRLLRALAGLGVLVEAGDGRFANSELGELFREGVAGSRRSLVRMLVPESYRNWDHFMETLRTGVTGQSLAHGGTLWDLIARDPDFGARFNTAMAGNTEQMANFVGSAGDFSHASVVVDVGGGEGSLVAGVLRAHPGLRGVVYDLAAGLVQTQAYLSSHGVADRCEIVEGNFFESVPKGDVYLLKDILHDWDDDAATAILRVCRREMSAGKRLMIVERVMPSHITATPAHMNATMTDLQMMVQLGGQERTEEQFVELFAAAHLRLDRFTPGGVYQLLEAIPV
jgi:O-methyltransferase/methyltransferase family protein